MIPIRILQGVQALHQRGYHRVRILPGVGASGVHWRLEITLADKVTDDAVYPRVVNPDKVLRYSTGELTKFASAEISEATTPDSVADLIVNELPAMVPSGDDPAYASWFTELLRLVETSAKLPIAYGEYFDAAAGWEIGWGSGVRHPRPPANRE